VRPLKSSRRGRTDIISLSGAVDPDPQEVLCEGVAMRYGVPGCREGNAMLFVVAAMMASPMAEPVRAPMRLSDCRTPLILMSANADMNAAPRVRKDPRGRPAQRPCLTLANA
jgi:hypothetical protein